MHENIRCLKLSETPKKISYEVLWYCKTTSFRRKILIIPPSLAHQHPPPCHPYIVSTPETFLKLRGVLLRTNLGIVRQPVLDGN